MFVFGNISSVGAVIPQAVARAIILDTWGRTAPARTSLAASPSRTSGIHHLLRSPARQHRARRVEATTDFAAINKMQRFNGRTWELFGTDDALAGG
jgi:hypothetical protein